MYYVQLSETICHLRRHKLSLNRKVRVSSSNRWHYNLFPVSTAKVGLEEADGRMCWFLRVIFLCFCHNAGVGGLLFFQHLLYSKLSHLCRFWRFMNSAFLRWEYLFKKRKKPPIHNVLKHWNSTKFSKKNHNLPDLSIIFKKFSLNFFCP